MKLNPVHKKKFSPIGICFKWIKAILGLSLSTLVLVGCGRRGPTAGVPPMEHYDMTEEHTGEGQKKDTCLLDTQTTITTEGDTIIDTFELELPGDIDYIRPRRRDRK